MAVSKKSHVKRGIVCGVIAVFAVVVIAAFLPSFRSPNANQSPCKLSDSDARPIQFKRLSDEKSFPFLRDGGPPRKGGKDYNEYQAAIARFPDIRSCLIDSEKETQIPTLTRFDWNKIRGTKDAEVCLFRVFSSIGNVEESNQWLEKQGFETTIYSSTGDDGLGRTISANWSIRKCGGRFDERSLLDQLLGPGAYAFWASAGFTADGEIRGIGAGFDVK